MTTYFVTGTDTNVGKTAIAVALVRYFTKQRLTVGAFKPVASGSESVAGKLCNDDALQLHEAANAGQSYSQVNPYAFAPAIAPHIAAEQVDETVSCALLKQHFQTMKNAADHWVVEGAGGWLVPLNDSETLADLAREIADSVILVVGIKLGCINHALLSQAAIRQSGLQIAGWVANCCEANESVVSEQIATLASRLSMPLLGVVPYSAEDLVHQVEINLDFDLLEK